LVIRSKGRCPDAQGLGLEDANLFKGLMVGLPHARAEALNLGLEEPAHEWVVRKPRAGEGGGLEGLASLVSSLNATACSPPEAKNFAQAVALPSFVWQSVPVMEVSEGQRAPNWVMMLAMTPMNGARSIARRNPQPPNLDLRPARSLIKVGPSWP
jgi:hypothetical protein